MADGTAVEQCVALIDYDAQFPDEISFRRGDVLHVTHKGGHSGYWQGYVSYPASTSRVVEMAAALAEAGDEEGAAHVMASMAKAGPAEYEASAAVWPALRREDDDDDDNGSEDSDAAHESAAAGRAAETAFADTQFDRTGALVRSEGEEPLQTASSSHASSQQAGRRGRRAVISSFFSSLKSHRGRHRNKEKTEQNKNDNCDENTSGRGESNSCVSHALPPSRAADMYGGGRDVDDDDEEDQEDRPHNEVTPRRAKKSAQTSHIDVSKHLSAEKKRAQKALNSHGSPARDDARAASLSRASATVGRTGLFPNCTVSSNVEPDLALMRAFQQKCLALFPYQARDASELSFDAEDVLTAVRPGPSPGWWYGYNVSALEPIRRLARKQLRRRSSSAHLTTTGATTTTTAGGGGGEGEAATHPAHPHDPLTVDVPLPWEHSALAGNKTPDRPSRTNPPLHLSPFLFSRCSQRFEDSMLRPPSGADEEESIDAALHTPLQSSTPGHSPSRGAPRLSRHTTFVAEGSEDGNSSFVSTNVSTASFGSTLMEPHHWTFLSSLDPATRAKVEGRCGTLRRPLLFPINYVTSDIVLTVFRFERRQPHELSIDVGDVVRVHRRWNDGWWEGSLRGERGIFPSNYTIPNVPSLRDTPFGATGTTTSTCGEDDVAFQGIHPATTTRSTNRATIEPLASTMAAMTFPPLPATPLTPLSPSHGEKMAVSFSSAAAAPIFFCPQCKSILAAATRAEVVRNASTCPTCQQHEAITDAMLSALEQYVYGEASEGDAPRGPTTAPQRPPRLDLFSRVPLYPDEVGSVPSLLTNKDVADVSFGRVKFV